MFRSPIYVLPGKSKRHAKSGNKAPDGYFRGGNTGPEQVATDIVGLSTSIRPNYIY